MPRGYDRPLYILPFYHRGSFQTKMFGWQSPLTDAQTAEIADTKKVIYDGFLAALVGGVPKERAGILVDEQFGAAILATLRPRILSPLVRLRKADKQNSNSNMARISRATSKLCFDLLQSSGALQSGRRSRTEQAADGSIEAPVRFPCWRESQPVLV